jgi:hypothetical protein
VRGEDAAVAPPGQNSPPRHGRSIPPGEPLHARPWNSRGSSEKTCMQLACGESEAEVS